MSAQRASTQAAAATTSGHAPRAAPKAGASAASHAGAAHAAAGTVAHHAPVVNTVPVHLAEHASLATEVREFATNWEPVIFILFFAVLILVMWRTLKVMPRIKPQQIKPASGQSVNFNDIAGVDDAKGELQEIVEFLRDPKSFHALGAKVPKGILLHGPPGTGKTMLAKAVAKESGAQFFAQSAASFVEMFAGLGAARIRRLFAVARKHEPAIIFIDELDAVGGRRGADISGEKDQTLNQLLVEMDGFSSSGRVVVIAASNLLEKLDPALLRPGRFDRQIVVAQPDLAGRRGILKVHARGKPIAADADLDIIARRTPGFTGADLANVINEAALLTARKNGKQIHMAALEEAIDRVMAGPERKSVLLSESERKLIAYHEGGHALVGHAMAHADPVHKVTIIPRGRALGYTQALPTEDKFLTTRAEMQDQLAMLLGGRTAEELIFHEPTSGAANDIDKATQIARSMVTEYGMSERLGARKFGSGDAEPFLGMDRSHSRDYSEEIASAIDEEIKRLIEAAHDEAWEVLVEYRDVLDNLVLRLLDKETLSRKEVLEVFATVQKRPIRGTYTGYGKRLPSDRPPVLSPKELALAASSGLSGDGSGKTNGQAIGYGLDSGTPAGDDD